MTALLTESRFPDPDQAYRTLIEAHRGLTDEDSAALNSHKLGDITKKKADPFNAHEPVDSSAAAIAAQGFIRLGLWLQAKGDKKALRGETQPIRYGRT